MARVLGSLSSREDRALAPLCMPGSFFRRHPVPIRSSCHLDDEKVQSSPFPVLPGSKAACPTGRDSTPLIPAQTGNRPPGRYSCTGHPARRGNTSEDRRFHTKKNRSPGTSDQTRAIDSSMWPRGHVFLHDSSLLKSICSAVGARREKRFETLGLRGRRLFAIYGLSS